MTALRRVVIGSVRVPKWALKPVAGVRCLGRWDNILFLLLKRFHIVVSNLLVTSPMYYFKLQQFPYCHRF